MGNTKNRKREKAVVKFFEKVKNLKTNEYNATKIIIQNQKMDLSKKRAEYMAEANKLKTLTLKNEIILIYSDLLTAKNLDSSNINIIRIGNKM